MSNSQPETQLGFDVTAKIKFAKQEIELTTDISSLVLTFKNGSFIPTLNMTFFIDSKYSNMLLLPYTVDLTIIEKNLKTDNRTSITAEFLNLTNKSSFTQREADQPKKPDRMQITNSFVLKDAYALNNSSVSGAFKNKTIKEVLQQLWRQTNHGSLQLDLGDFDNKEKYDTIWIPQLTFINAFRYIVQYYGLYNTLSINTGDLRKIVIKSVNEIKDKPIELIMRASESSELINIDEYRYGILQLPNIQNNFNSIAISIPKKITIIKHNKESLYSKETVDVVQHMRSLDHVDNTDVYSQFLDKYVKLENSVTTNQTNTYAIKEALSNILTNTIKPANMSISDPFRFTHWNIGRRINFSSNHLMYAGIDVSFFISKLQFNISQDNNKRWRGTVDVQLKTGSTRNIKV